MSHVYAASHESFDIQAYYIKKRKAFSKWEFV